jgi:subtilisin family serine protease/subtilisin-like proprotein convertase family protein
MNRQLRSRSAPKARLQVEQLECRSLLSASVAPTAVLAPGTIQIDSIPNDPSFGAEWGMLNSGGGYAKAGADIHAPQAWDVTTGSMKTVAAVIDTGIDYRDRDLYQNLWVNQAEIPDFWFTKSSASSTTYNKLVHKTDIKDVDGDGLLTFRDFNAPQNAGLIWDNNGNGFIDAGDLLRPLSQGGWNSGSTKDGDTAHPDDFFGWNFVKNNNNPLDDNNHGSHVAGIIGAVGNNSFGIAGVDWSIQLMAVKVIDSNGIGTEAAAVAGINYAVAHGAVLSNNSYSTSFFDQAMYDAINNARAHGQIVVTASGNGMNYQGINLDSNPSYPASYNLPNVVTVAATSNSDTLASFSNYGKATVALGAPGINILSTIRNDGTQYMTGTSMAAPFVTGVLGLVSSQHPTWKYYQVVNQVLATVDPLTALAGKTTTGGRLDAYRAVTQVIPDTGATIVSAIPNGSGGQPVSSIRITFTEGINASSFTLADVLSFSGPNGSIPVTAIVPVYNTDDRQFDVVFAQQTKAGTYTLKLGNGILDVAGNPLAQSSYTTSFVIQPTNVFTNSTKIAIPDFNVVPGVASSPVTVGSDITIGKVTVLINISHTCDNDLYIHLRGPDGTDVVLADRRGLLGHNYTNTQFDDAATTPISAGTAPYAGTFAPEMPLSAFNGKDAKGTWQLIVEDRQAIDVGTINSWSLSIQAAAPATATVHTASVSSGVVRMASLTEPIGDASGVKAGDTVNLPAPGADGPVFAGLLVPLHQNDNGPAPGATTNPEPARGAPQDDHATDSAFASVWEHSQQWTSSDGGDQSPSTENLLAFFEQQASANP